MLIHFSKIILYYILLILLLIDDLFPRDSRSCGDGAASRRWSWPLTPWRRSFRHIMGVSYRGKMNKTDTQSRCKLKMNLDMSKMNEHEWTFEGSIYWMLIHSFQLKKHLKYIIGMYCFKKHLSWLFRISVRGVFPLPALSTDC